MHFPRHIAFLCTLLSSGINPVILCFRAKRFRRALKQLLQNPFGKTTFQDTEQKKRSKENVTCKNECEAEKDKERNDPAACSSNSYIDEIVNTGKERGRRLRNQIMPFPSPDAHSQINPWLAWVGNHLTDPAEISSGEESPTPREDYTQHGVTEEVHPEPSDRSSKQENGEIQQHQTRHRDKSSKTNGVFFMVHSDSMSNQLNQKMIKIPVSSADCNDETILEMPKTCGQLRHASAEIVIVEVNSSPKDDPSNQNHVQSPIPGTNYARWVRPWPDTKLRSTSKSENGRHLL